MMKGLNYVGLVSAFLLCLGDATPVTKQSPLSVQLVHSGQSQVKATIKNTGSKTLRLLNQGTLLDSSPVQKFIVHGQGE
jgi:hypothetical protein